MRSERALLGDITRSRAGAIWWGEPGLWLALALLAAVFLMPATEPVFRALFPELLHPIYSRASFFELTLAHIWLVGLSSLAAGAAGLSLAIFVTRASGREFMALVSAVAAIGQTFPPVAVLALAIPALGYGAAPTLVALTLYAILPIFAAAVTGFEAVPESVRDAAVGLGFGPWEIFWRIEAPLAAPFMLSGLRSAVIINIGTATIGSSVGALSLGSPIIEGLSASNPAYVIEGALIVALLAMLIDRWFETLETFFRPRGSDPAPE